MTIESRELSAGWELASTAPDARADAGSLDDLEWLPAQVPGTAAAALRTAGLWRHGQDLDFDAEDWWFRTRFRAPSAAADEEVALVLEGIATVCEVYLDGERLLDGESMFAAHRVEIGGRLGAENELAICCRALRPRLGVTRRPRARWRTRLVTEGNLRFFRTMLLGRAPGFAPGPAAVGPWKPIRLERSKVVALEDLRLVPRLDGDTGLLSVQVHLRSLCAATAIEEAEVEVSGPNGTHRGQLKLEREGTSARAKGELVVGDAARWWPHTAGTPVLHRVRLLVRAGEHELAVDLGSVGFRELQSGGQIESDGIQLRVNGEPVFARGAVWTPPDLALPCTPEEEVRRVLSRVVDAGMNMLRVPGIGCYEGTAFYEACDELGIMVWQDFMFANLDYPEQDEEFMRIVEHEARQALTAVARRPCLAVLCGGSEVAQQVAMLGLDPKLANGPLYGELLPSLVAEYQLDAPYVPSTPWGGDLPFRPGRGVANYYGVGAYLRPLADARLSEVRFAAECLAFANVPDDEALEEIAPPGGLVVHDPQWKAGVPRDVGAGWDFDDVRDHYLRLLFDLDPVALRSIDHERYLDLSRTVTGDVMAEVFGEWRRSASPCGGALILWLKDVMPGAGWGVLDHRGEPKVVYHHLRRALAPVAVWSTDEGLGGVMAHVANDRPVPLQATLRVAMYRGLEIPVEEVEHPINLGPRQSSAHNVEELLGRFVDAAWAYRFGPPAQDLIVLSLEREAEGSNTIVSQSFREPAGRSARPESAAALGVVGTIRSTGEDRALLSVATRRFLAGARIRIPGFVAHDDAFSVEPGHTREVELRRIADGAPAAGHLTALNLAGRVAISTEAGP